MENTLENKAKFFAQYWGQRVLTDGLETHRVSSVFNLKHESFYLRLILLSSITDEDAIECAYINWPMYRKDKEKVDTEWLKKVLETISQNAKVSDYLRSKGYALSYLDLTVEELVLWGWVKLKDATNG